MELRAYELILAPAIASRVRRWSDMLPPRVKVRHWPDVQPCRLHVALQLL